MLPTNACVIPRFGAWSIVGVVVATLSATAYLQAHAISCLADTFLRHPRAPRTARPAPGPLGTPTPSNGEASRQAVTLPTKRSTTKRSTTPRATALDPLRALPCDDVFVSIVSESDDPTWSMATVGKFGESPLLLRIGDALDDFHVAFIGTNPRNLSPTVWLDDDGLCQVPLSRARLPPKKAPADARRSRSRSPLENRTPPPHESSLDTKIEKLSDTKYAIDRALFEEVVSNPMSLRYTLKPEMKDGEVVGMRVFGVRGNDLFGKLGLRAGDRVDAVNGYSLASPEGALSAYARLRTADRFEFDLVRNGKPMKLEIQVQ